MRYLFLILFLFYITISLAGWSGGSGADAVTDVSIKTADETVNSNTTLQNDDHLSAAVEANTVYGIYLKLLYNAHATPDIKYGWSVPTGATMMWSTADTVVSDETQILSNNGTATNIGLEPVTGILVVGANSGTLQFQFAQVNSSVENTTVLKGSHLVVWKT